MSSVNALHTACRSVRTPRDVTEKKLLATDAGTDCNRQDQRRRRQQQMEKQMVGAIRAQHETLRISMCAHSHRSTATSVLMYRYHPPHLTSPQHYTRNTGIHAYAHKQQHRQHNVARYGGPHRLGDDIVNESKHFGRLRNERAAHLPEMVCVKRRIDQHPVDTTGTRSERASER